jgi:hypothetical protein
MILTLNISAYQHVMSINGSMTVENVIHCAELVLDLMHTTATPAMKHSIKSTYLVLHVLKGVEMARLWAFLNVMTVI